MEELRKEELICENNTVEYKSAKGGLPNSFYETYSAFANSYGGTIYFGIAEISKGIYTSSHLSETDVEKLRYDLFSTINNKEKVSVNLLDDALVTTKSFEGGLVLEIKIMKCPKQYKPVYINNNILTGTFRRNNEGDYHCSVDEIKAMLRDSSFKAIDTQMLSDFKLSDLSQESIETYRNLFTSLHPNHTFSKQNNTVFLEFIGAIKKGEDNEFHPTIAGLTVFSYSYKIAYEFPEYFLDYQELYRHDNEVRWTDRLNSDTGDFSGNLLDFYFAVSKKLISDLKTPFQMNGTTRIDESIMQKAFREALANAIFNYDFYQSRGLVIKKYIDHIDFYNPGCLMLDPEIAFKGRESDARNKTIQKIFNLIGVGERVGSGLPLIAEAAKINNYKKPTLSDTLNPDRSKLTIYLTANNEINEKPKNKEKVNKAHKK